MNAMDSKPAVLRLKRKRGEMTPDTFVIETDAPPVAKRANLNDVVDALAAISTESAAEGPAEAVVAQKPTAPAKPVFRFKKILGSAISKADKAKMMDHIRVVFNDKVLGKGAVTSDTAADKSIVAMSAMKGEALAKHKRKQLIEKRRLARSENASDPEQFLRASFKMYDVEWNPPGPVASAAEDMHAISNIKLVRRRVGYRDKVNKDFRASFVPVAMPMPHRVFTPIERMMDEAVWAAFRMGDFAPFFRALELGGDVNFQRKKSDLSTGLMAAACKGEAKIVAALLRRNALVRINDCAGNNAVAFARQAGHVQLAALLQDVLQEELEEHAEWVALIAGMSAPPSSRSATQAGSGMALEEDDEYEFYILDPKAADETGEDGSAAYHAHADDRLAIDMMQQDEEEGFSDDEWDDGRDRAHSIDSEDSNAENEDRDDYPDEDESWGRESEEGGYSTDEEELERERERITRYRPPESSFHKSTLMISSASAAKREVAAMSAGGLYTTLQRPELGVARAAAVDSEDENDSDAELPTGGRTQGRAVRFADDASYNAESDDEKEFIAQRQRLMHSMMRG